MIDFRHWTTIHHEVHFEMQSIYINWLKFSGYEESSNSVVEAQILKRCAIVHRDSGPKVGRAGVGVGDWLGMEDAAFRELDVGRAGVCAEDSVGVEGGVVGDPNVVDTVVGGVDGVGLECSIAVIDASISSFFDIVCQSNFFSSWPHAIW